MQPQQLRKGNYVNKYVWVRTNGRDLKLPETSSVYKVCSIGTFEVYLIYFKDKEACVQPLMEKYNEITGIELTQDVLTILGFEKHKEDGFYYKYDFEYTLHLNASGCIVNPAGVYYIISNVKYVHELQNLWYALTKEELSIIE